MIKMKMLVTNNIKFKNGMGTFGLDIPQPVFKINKYFLYELRDPES
jgi:hypothetical protein